MWALAVLILIVAIFIYLRNFELCNYWTKNNVPQVKPWPILGNMAPLVLGKYSMIELLQRLYYTDPNKRYCGMYQFQIPTLIIKDPKLVKEITVKSFDSFPEHNTLTTEKADPIVSKNLVFMKGGKKWHSLRYTLSPVFTSNKLKLMFQLMSQCSTQFIDHFDRQKAFVKVDLKDAFTRFTNDLIASTAFGVNCNSLDNPENEFYSATLEGVNNLKGLKLFIRSVCPTVMEFLNVRVVSKKVELFFRNIVNISIAMRKQTGVIRLDLIHLLMEAQKGRLKADENNNHNGLKFASIQDSQTEVSGKIEKYIITDEDIAAQAFVFCLAGYDTGSTAMCFASYELAINPDIQQRLQDEVDSVVANSNGEPVTYETLLQMKYMDCVVAETLRKWPPITFTDRRAVKPYIIKPEELGEQPVHLDIGTVCWIPIYSIHRDPIYYPNPDTFDPERFNDENKHNINPFAYLPFGSGPKTCIGARFAVMETKLILFSILAKFDIVATEDTKIPLVLTGKTFLLEADKGLSVGLRPRNLH